MIVFPPNWGHTVLTMAGPNVMLNMREQAFWQSFSEQPFRFLETMWSFIVMERRRHATTAYNKLQMELYRQREMYYDNNDTFVPPDSGCKDVLKTLLHKPID